MLRNLIRCGVVAGVVGLGACELEVINPNSPTTVQVKLTPADLENFLGTQFRRWHAALHGTTANIWGMANVMSFENFSTLSNNCQGQRMGIPRPGNDNAVGNACGPEQLRVYTQAHEAARSVSDVLRKLDEGLTFGSEAQDLRGRSFAEFLRGLSLGYLALVYDSASIVKPDDPLTAGGTAEPGELSGYKEVMAEAITALDNAQTAATSAAALGPSATNFPLPSTWINGYTPTAAQFIQLIRSFRARFRANVARYPAERIAVNWDAVIADAQAGITTDWKVTTNTVTGPFNSWPTSTYQYNTWHQMTPFIYGMADKSGAYAAWIATPLATRGAGAVAYFQTSDDQRLPQGADRAAQQADFKLTSCTAAATICKRYFLNRESLDPAASPSWGGSQYDHVRFFSWRTSGSAGTGQNGPFPFFTVAELNMLEAEGHIRKNNFAAAAALIDKTRAACFGVGAAAIPAGCTARPAGNGDPGTGGGLPKLAGVVLDGTTPVPGGASCVPLVPSGATSAGGGTVSCGNIFEAMKWEKRIETAYTHFAGWYFDSRGWGDLPVNTPVHWAPPNEELTTRFRVGTQIYSTGGPNPTGGAAVSGYGW